jgi:hypothetical protein
MSCFPFELLVVLLEGGGSRLDESDIVRILWGNQNLFGSSKRAGIRALDVRRQGLENERARLSGGLWSARRAKRTPEAFSRKGPERDLLRCLRSSGESRSRKSQ